MNQNRRGDIARYLVSAGLRFQPGAVEGPSADDIEAERADVQALVERLAALRQAPRKRALRHTVLTAPGGLTPVG